MRDKVEARNTALNLDGGLHPVGEREIRALSADADRTLSIAGIYIPRLIFSYATINISFARPRKSNGEGTSVYSPREKEKEDVYLAAVSLGNASKIRSLI